MKSSLPRARVPRPETKASPPGHRLDIQGLRTIAVGLVIADHVFGKPVGGFIGVDIFLVISGFLITGLLLREGEKTGRISIGNFYRRRVRRIFPAAIVTIGVTVVVSYAVLTSSRFESVAGDGFWSLLFVVNWHFASAGTDYFNQQLPDSPLQHFWSLSVEEQFYLVWPVLLIGLLFAAKRARGRGGSVNVGAWAGGFAALAIVSSFAWAWWQSSAEPTIAYFSTVTRAWELGVGALLAVVGPGLMNRASMAVRNVLAVAGYAGVVFGALVITPEDPFPAPLGAIPVLGTALLLASGIGAAKQVAATRPISIQPITYIGNLSYSLYLWHWPILVVGLALYDETTAFRIGVLALTVAVSMLSYHCIEQPILKSQALAPSSARSRRGWDGVHQHTQYVLVAGLAFGATLLVIASLIPKSTPTSTAVAGAFAAQVQEQARKEAAATNVDWVSAGVQDALRSASFPEMLNPPLEDARAAAAPQMSSGGCFNADLSNTAQCTSGGGGKLAVVTGDSVAMSWTPGIIEALRGDGYRVHAVGMSDCPFADVRVTLDNKDFERQCNASRHALYQHIKALKPDLLVTSDFEGNFGRLASGSEGETAAQEWTKGMASAIAAATAPRTSVVVLAPPPAGLSPDDCAGRLSAPRDCASSVAKSWDAKSKAELVATTAAGARYVDTRPWFCFENECPIFALGTTIRWDSVHLTASYAKVLAPKLRAELLNLPEVESVTTG